MPKRSRYVFVCTKERAPDHKKGSCARQGGEALVSLLKLETKKAKLDVKVTSSGCFDLCWVGAAVSIMPDSVFLKNVTLEDVPRLVEALALSQSDPLAELLADKLATLPDFEDPTKREPKP